MKRVLIKDVGKVITGNTPSKNNTEFYDSDDIGFIKPDGLGATGITLVNEAREYISENARKKARIVEKGTVLVTCIGNIGKMGIVENKEITFNQQINAIIPNKSVLSKYLAYNILSNRKRLEAIANAPVVPIINKTQFENFEILIHEEINEQARIVSILDNLTNIIDNKKKQLEEYDHLIKSRFVEMFDNISETVPVSYYVKSLTAGKSLAGEEECSNKVLKTGAVSYDYFDATQVKNLPIDHLPLSEHQIKDGDIIISRMNTSELVGAAAYVWEAPDKTFLPDRLWRANLHNNCNPIFVWQSLIQPSIKEQISRDASGTSGSMKNISKPGLLGIKVKLIPFEQQEIFASVVKQVYKLKSVVQKSLDETQVLFESLMQNYFD